MNRWLEGREGCSILSWYSCTALTAGVCLLLTHWGRNKIVAIFKCIFLNENVQILLKISLKFVPKVRINNIQALVQIMAWRRPGDRPLSEPIVYWHIYVSLGLNELKLCMGAVWKTVEIPIGHVSPQSIANEAIPTYCKISNIRGAKSQNLMILVSSCSCLWPKLLKPDVRSRMKM